MRVSDDSQKRLEYLTLLGKIPNNGWEVPKPENDNPSNDWEGRKIDELFLSDNWGRKLKRILMMQCYVCEMLMYVRAAGEICKSQVYVSCQV